MLCMWLLIALIARSTDGLLCTQQKAAETDLKQLIEEHRATDGHLPFIAGFVRLAFHDCAGGCDGCINFGIADNAGLDVYTKPLDLLYAKNQKGYGANMSRADLWALAGITAANYGAAIKTQCGSSVEPCRQDENHPRMPMTFRTGRTDCGQSSSTQNPNELPSGLGDSNHVIDYFARTFNFTERESVCILASHSLGEAHKNVSGFHGPWTPTKSTLNNRFFVELYNRDWRQINAGTQDEPKYQWTISGATTGGHLMLNTDVSLLKDADLESTGESNCVTLRSCAQSPLAHYVEQFAIYADEAMDCFGATFEKMLGSGGKGKRLSLREVVDDCKSTGNTQQHFSVGLLVLLSLAACRFSGSHEFASTPAKTGPSI